MLIPSDSKLPHFRFVCHGFDFAIALFEFDPVAYPGIVYPLLMKKNTDGKWDEIDRRDPIWKDIQSDIDPEFMAGLIVDDFNKTIATFGGAPMTYEQKLAQALANNFVVVNNQLVKKV